MATVTVTNLTSEDLYDGDQYVTIPADGSIEFEWPYNRLPELKTLGQLKIDGSVRIRIVPNATELVWDDPEIHPFEKPLVFKGSKRMVIAATDLEADDTLVLAVSATGNEPGGKISLVIPAGLLDAGLADNALIRSAALDPAGVTYDPTEVWYLEAECTSLDPLRFKSVLTQLEALDAVVPTLDLAVIVDDQLLLTMSEACVAGSVTGMTLTTNSTTPITVTSLLSGSGTVDLVFQLSRSVAQGETITLTLESSHALQDIDANLVAEGDTTCTVVAATYVMPGEVFDYNGDTATFNLSDEVTAAPNNVTGSDFPTMTISTIKPTKAIAPNGKLGFSFPANSYMKADSADPVTMTAGTLMAIVKTTNVAVAAKATGTITTTLAANILDGETFTLDDGINTPTVFEFDKVPDGVAGTNVVVDISAAVTADDVRDAIITAITGVGGTLAMAATSGGAATVNLENDTVGQHGNTSQSETVVNAGFVITNMTGGVDTYETFISMGLDGALTTPETTLAQKGDTDDILGRRVNAGTGDATGNGTGIAYHSVIFVFNGPSSAVYVDGASVATSAVVAAAAAVGRVTLGMMADLVNNGSQGDLEIYYAKGSTTKLTAPQVAVAATFSQFIYGTPGPV